MSDRYEIGSETYCDLCNDEGGIVCEEFATEEMDGNALYEQFCGETGENVDWPESGTEDEIRAASRLDWERKLTAAGYTRND